MATYINGQLVSSGSSSSPSTPTTTPEVANEFLLSTQEANTDVVTILGRIEEQLLINNMYLAMLTGEEVTTHELNQNRGF
jgi:hypothetical protein